MRETFSICLLEVHHIVQLAGRFSFDNMIHLDRLPPRGFQLLVIPSRVENVTGGSVRDWLVLPTEEPR